VLTPDDIVLNDGGDMTRIIVSLVDSSGRFIRSRGDSITMSASGAGDFIGESRSALEGGQFAFYVKTRDGVFGTINCQASVIGNTGVAAGTATITVQATVVKDNPLSSAPCVFSAQNPYVVTIMKNRVVVPSRFRKNASVFVYDLSGKLLCRQVVKQGMNMDLGKAIGASNAVYIVRFEDKKTVRH
jgi:hypothetical protein